MRLISVFLVLFFLLFGNISHGEYAPDLGDNMMIQLQGEINTSYNVDVYSIDLFDTSTEFISKLQEKNIGVICYFSAGTFENWREDAELFPIEVLGKDLSNWPGEKWLDVSKYDLFKDIMLARLDLAEAKGCDGVDPDNVDAFQNDTGLKISDAEQKQYLIFLSQEAKKRNLYIGLKNNLTQIEELEPYFDFAINESCFSWNECDYMLPFIENNKPVFGLQYDKNIEDFCPEAIELNMSFAKANYDLNGNEMNFCNTLESDKTEEILEPIEQSEEKKSDESKLDGETLEVKKTLVDIKPELAKKVDSLFIKIEQKYSQEQKMKLYKKLKQKFLILKTISKYQEKEITQLFIEYVLVNIPNN